MISERAWNAVLIFLVLLGIVGGIILWELIHWIWEHLSFSWA